MSVHVHCDNVVFKSLKNREDERETRAVDKDTKGQEKRYISYTRARDNQCTGGEVVADGDGVVFLAEAKQRHVEGRR